MNSTQALQHIITEYGRAILTDTRKVEILLKDLCPKPEYKREVNILVLASKENIPNELINKQPANDMLIMRLIKKLEDAYFIPAQQAQIAIETWANILNVNLQKNTDIIPKQQQTKNIDKSDTEISLSDVEVDWYLASDARKLFTKAKHGDKEAQYELGQMYDWGDGVQENEAEAVKWYKLAAEQGHIDAQSELGFRYSIGMGVEYDETESAKWYLLAAKQGDKDAQYILGGMYSVGEGVKYSKTESRKWYLLAADQYRLVAEQGDKEAQYRLGNMYAKGEGLSKNDNEAKKWYRLAADQYRLAAGQGDIFAQRRLGDMYAKGEGVSENKIEAKKWYRLAADQGDSYAKDKLNAL